MRPPHELWWQWSWEPVFLVVLALWAVLYARGFRRVRVGQLRERAGSKPVLEAVSYFAGLSVFALAIISPLDALGAALFSAHMVQHLVLVIVAAPLLVLGRPWVVALHGLQPRGRRTVLRMLRLQPLRTARAALTDPLVVLLVHTAALWAWHIPAWYEAALASTALHWLEHVAFFGTALLYWSVVWHSRLSRGLVVLYLFAGATQGALLGALITVARVPWYTAHDAGTRAWGLTLLEDQQLAGLLMWVPGAAVYLGTALVVGAAWLAQAEVAVRRRERQRALGLGGSSRR